MKVIALTGGANTGKSHTINIAYSFLLRDGYTQVPGHFRILGDPANKDVFDVLEKHGKKVGIIGMGDYVITAGALKKLLAEIQNLGCSVTICACRDNPKIEAAVKAYTSHVLIPKTPSAGPHNDRIVNVADAETLISHI